MSPQWLGALEARRRTHRDDGDGEETGLPNESRVGIAADYQSLLAKVAAFAQTLGAE
jgi:hypothetical protein